MEIPVDQLGLILGKYPWLVNLLFWFFVIRVVNKFLFSVVGKYVELTDSTKDNKWFKSITDSKVYKFIAFVLDLGLSIKMPK